MGISSGAKKVLEADVSSEIQAIEGIKRSMASLAEQLEAREFRLNAMLGAIGKSEQDIHPAVNGEHDSSNTTFREVIRMVLRESGSWMTVREIADGLNDIGYEYTKKTDITTRLSNDLSRMVASGNVEKDRQEREGRETVVYQLKIVRRT